jgi:hypothetical protein
MNKCLTGSWFHCLFAFSSGFLLIGSDPLLSSSNGLPWLAAGLRHECRFDFISAYNLILILLFGICGSDFCVSDGRLLFRSFGICPFDSVFTNRKESFFKVCAIFRCAFGFQDVFWNGIVQLLSGCPVLWKDILLICVPYMWFSAGMCSVYLFSFVLHKETKGTYTLFTFITTGSES